MENIEKIRHSLAHLLAKAVLTIDPKAQLGVGPTIESGFYYDFRLSKKIDESVLAKLESLMRDAINQNLGFKPKRLKLAEAKKFFKNQPFKLELINDLAKYGTTSWQEIQTSAKTKKTKKNKISDVSLYQTGDFVDLCRGGHVKKTKEIKLDAFKLTKIAGAYWRGDEKNQMLTRIYGVAFETKKELDEYLERQKTAEIYNHRVLGDQLDIFMISEKVGSGLPLFLPRGEFIKNQLINLMREKEERYGYQYVSTPVLAESALYEASGHKKYFGNEMYRFNDPEGNEVFIKPMSCPHHHMIYQRLVKSYRDLPLRLAEPGTVYRFERSGALYGLMRVRGPITQNDSHIYVDRERLADEFRNVLKLFNEFYSQIKISDKYWYRLSLPDFKGKNKEKFGGDEKLWRWAANEIKKVAVGEKLNLTIGIGEASFYGPKLDLQIRNIFGKEETLSTIQIDIVVPKRMGLFYLDKNNKKVEPIVIHRAVIGSYERFIGFFLESTRGDLPLWLSETQIMVVPIGEKHLNRAKKVAAELLAKNIRAKISLPNESLNKRILFLEKEKIPYLAIIGDREEANGSVALRGRHRKDLGEFKLGRLINKIKKEILTKMN